MSLPPTTPTLNVFISCLPVAPYRTQLTEQIQAYGQACRERALEEAINCYSPDDTASDYIEKIRSLK